LLYVPAFTTMKDFTIIDPVRSLGVAIVGPEAFLSSFDDD